MKLQQAIPALLILGLVALATPATPAAAQEGDAEMAAMMEAYEEAGTPGEVHDALARMTGEWETTVKFWMDPSAEPDVSRGTMTSRMVMGGRFLEEEMDSEFMGQQFRGRALTGYDNVEGECNAVWIDNMSTAIYHYTGSVNGAGDRIELKGEYTDAATGEHVKTRSVREVVSKDRMVETIYEIRDGVESRTMEITYTRK